MNPTFNPDAYKRAGPSNDQYEKQLRRLIDDGKDVDCIEQAVRGALGNLSSNDRKAFVIYGEPQSGKTEMMICLTAKLLDQGRLFIIHLLNDSVDLLNQNLGRFQASGLAPSAQNYTEILDPTVNIKAGRHVIFCKKNARDLQKLLNKLGKMNRVVVIDDEADFASPNAKINQNEQTKINELISELLGKTGDYIGVTATPARLDLNNTFSNDSQLWVMRSPMTPQRGQTGPCGHNTVSRYSRAALSSWKIDFRANTRDLDDAERAALWLASAQGKRLLYRQPNQA